MSDAYNATLLERIDLTPALAVVKIRPDSGELPGFKAGQFCTLGLPAPLPPESGTVHANDGPGSHRDRPKLVRRAYSIASPPKWRDHLELYIVLVQEGRLTPRLWTVDQGGRLFLDPKIRGEFTLDPVPNDADVVTISTGTGIAPFMSMLREYQGQNRWRRFVIIHGVREACDLGYRDQIESLMKTDPTVKYIPVVSRQPESSGWHGLHGRVQAALVPEVYEKYVGAKLEAAHSHVLLCGNPDMIKSVQADLSQQGFVTATKDTPGNVHFERYW